jgi:hypothetical protein
MDLPLSPSTGVLEEFDQSKTVLPSYEIIVAEVRAYNLPQLLLYFILFYLAVRLPYAVTNIAEQS